MLTSVMNASLAQTEARQRRRQRIYAIDFLRGMVMILMVLDHVRYFFYYGSFLNNPLDLETTTPALFFTRWITHLCAPAFVLLAGVSIYLNRQKMRDERKLSRFLLARGLWLIALEFLVINFAWFFDPQYQFFNVQVIYAIGACFVLFAGLIWLPNSVILGLGLAIIIGHNLVEGVAFQAKWLQDLWLFLMAHGMTMIGDKVIAVNYPLIPWLGVMCLGYSIGGWYTERGADSTEARRSYLLWGSLLLLLVFALLRTLNIYGDPAPWGVQESGIKSLMAFLKVTKYPPSLLFALIMLGIAGLLLWGADSIKRRGAARFVITFGRVPLFFYLLHLFLAHLLAFAGAWVDGHPLELMVITPATFQQQTLLGYGFPLWVVYAVWALAIALLYPVCRWYQSYKMAHPEQWWLRYL